MTKLLNDDDLGVLKEFAKSDICRSVTVRNFVPELIDQHLALREAVRELYFKAKREKKNREYWYGVWAELKPMLAKAGIETGDA